MKSVFCTAPSGQGKVFPFEGFGMQGRIADGHRHRRRHTAGGEGYVLAGLSIFAAWAFVVTAVSAQPPAPAQPPPGGRGRGTITSPRNAYPDRAPGDPAAIERGKALYGVNCQFCHGADTRGGDGGPSLLRSATVLGDQDGELIAPVVRSGRPGMPKFTLSDDQIKFVAAFVHSFRAAGYDESRNKPPSIIVGDSKAGEAFFNARCASCHSTTGDLRGLAGRIPDERLLQQTWLMPGSGGGRGGPPPVTVPPVMATVTLPSGEKIEGRLDRLDDFTVSLTTADGTHRSFRTIGNTPRVDVRDPLQPHRDLLGVYTDGDIHNVTAFLVTLK
jgi:mono/diheme cytochrome c family protein